MCWDNQKLNLIHVPCMHFINNDCHANTAFCMVRKFIYNVNLTKSQLYLSSAPKFALHVLHKYCKTNYQGISLYIIQANNPTVMMVALQISSQGKSPIVTCFAVLFSCQIHINNSYGEYVHIFLQGYWWHQDHWFNYTGRKIQLYYTKRIGLVLWICNNYITWRTKYPVMLWFCHHRLYDRITHNWKILAPSLTNYIYNVIHVKI
jgi:hypothetical protein